MSMPSTTFQKLIDKSACEEGYKKLAKSLGGISKYGKDSPITLIQILDSNGLDDALWALRACDGCDRFARELACDFADECLPIFEKYSPKDDRPRKAIEVARRYACGEAMQKELDAARAAAWAAGIAARDADWAASWAARASDWAARASDWASDWAAAEHAARAARAAAWASDWAAAEAARAARAARDAWAARASDWAAAEAAARDAGAAAGAAARAARAKQENILCSKLSAIA